jgi:small subunit ribosomal protein S8
MDTIGDFITILRNASRASLPSCTASWSNLREGIAKVLLEKGFIAAYKVRKEGASHAYLDMALKYAQLGAYQKAPAIVAIQRHSKPGRRLYYGYDAIPKTLGGLGFGILSTSKGIMTDKEARSKKIGGELLCTVW